MVIMMIDKWTQDIYSRPLTTCEKTLLENIIDLTCETKQKKLLLKACEIFNLSKRVVNACSK